MHGLQGEDLIEFDHFDDVGAMAVLKIEGGHIRHGNEAELVRALEHSRSGHQNIRLDIEGAEFLLSHFHHIVQQGARGEIIGGKGVRNPHAPIVFIVKERQSRDNLIVGLGQEGARRFFGRQSQYSPA